MIVEGGALNKITSFCLLALIGAGERAIREHWQADNDFDKAVAIIRIRPGDAKP